MKLNKFLIAASGVLLMLSSCDSFLDKQETEEMTFDKIWKQYSTTKQYFENAMGNIPNDNDKAIYSNYGGASDEVSSTYNWDYRMINFGTWNASNVPIDHDASTNKMTSLYRGIRECNIFMQNVMSCSDPAATQEELTRWQTCARFARAYYYFMMMRDLGPVFLVGDDLIDFTATTEALYRTRNTWDECVDYVVSEMQFCATHLTDTYTANADVGLPTSGAALAVISRLKLYSARPLFNGNTLYRGVKNPDGTNLFPQTEDNQKWVEAAQAAKAVIDAPAGYTLYRAGNNNPYEDYSGVMMKTWNTELIWSAGGWASRFTQSVHTAPTIIATGSGTAYGGVGPTQQQVDAYAMANGIYPITGYETDGTPRVDETSGYPKPSEEFYMEDFANPWYEGVGGDKSKAYAGTTSGTTGWPLMFKNREPRFYCSVFFANSYWKHGDKYTLISFAKGGNSNGSHDYPKSGYLINRYYDHSQNSGAGAWGNSTFPTFRLAEMYLNYIEAVLECTIRGVSGEGVDLTQAMAYWDDLRDRAGLKPIKEVYPTASNNELLELCHKERRVELAFENHRYFDTRTWMIAEQTDNGPMYGMDTTVPSVAKDKDDTPQAFWARAVFETRVFKSNHYLYPFTQRELDRNKMLTQNYGW